MEENKVIFRRPFDKEANSRYVKELCTIDALLKKIRLDLGKNPLSDMIMMSIAISQTEKLADKWGFECSEDMFEFVNNFGIAALFDIE